MILKISAVE